MRPAIVFDSVWKKFRRGERHNSLRDLLPSLARSAMRRRPDELADQEFWALRDVSFNVAPGEAVGIIGPNGAGKSTVLKLLTRILKPTRGRTDVRGRAGALIEIAAGFHPDLTGRENIYLQGAIMGMRQAEIRRKLDDIVGFAGLEGAIDTPVKRYSSGMNARLGFSIAAHLEPDALIIDEVLSVGDMNFQRRCVDRMLAFKQRGVAIVFVSHDLQAVSTLCDRALFLKGGVEASGTATEVIAAYLKTLGTGRHGGDDDLVALHHPELTDAFDQPAERVPPGAALRFSVECAVRDVLSDYTVGLLVVRSTDNLTVYHGNFGGAELGCGTLLPARPMRFSFDLAANLTRGQYHVAVQIRHNPSGQYVGQLWPASLFGVDERRTKAGVADLAVTASAGDVPARTSRHDSRLRLVGAGGRRSGSAGG